jgi:hypothetical protein
MKNGYAETSFYRDPIQGGKSGGPGRLTGMGGGKGKPHRTIQNRSRRMDGDDRSLCRLDLSTVLSEAPARSAARYGSRSALTHPFPLTAEPAFEDGPLDWGHPGGIEAKPNATIIQQQPAPSGTPASASRSLMLPPAQLTYDGPLVSLGLVQKNLRTLAIQTNLEFAFPHPGTTESGGHASGGSFGSATFAAGGRSGPAVVSWCAGLPPPTASFYPGCSAPDPVGFTTTTTGGLVTSIPPANGLVRYTATRNQFGGAARSRTLGTAMVFLNAGGLGKNDFPCSHMSNPLCLVAISSRAPNSIGAFGAPFGQTITRPSFTTPNSVYTADVDDLGHRDRRLQIWGRVRAKDLHANRRRSSHHRLKASSYLWPAHSRFAD